MKLHNEDCIIQMRKMIDEGVQVDSVVTDPPYELGFMGKSWDSTGIAFQKETWELAFQLLKPGGHLLAFSGSRTYHRMAVAIEDAGFEIRDQIMWLYGSGFPKSLNIGKAVDNKLGAKRKVIGKKMGKGGENLNKLSREGKGDSEEAKGLGAYGLGAKQTNVEIDITEPATPEAKQWEGWGTALKPAHEPVVMARKPVEGTVADNVLKHGTGGINIDDCRIDLSEGDDPRLGGKGTWKTDKMAKDVYVGGYAGEETGSSELGRFPANVIHDGSEEVLEGFPYTKSGKMKQHIKGGQYNVYGKMYPRDVETIGDEGSAARFFYCPKVSKSERNQGLGGFEEKQTSSMSGRRDPHDMEKSKIDNDVTGRFVTTRKNIHPTVKPVELMKYLCRLVTPKGGTVLDPFMGSGSTGMAAVDEGFDFLGIEKEEEYFKIAKNRIDSQSPLMKFL